MLQKLDKDMKIPISLPDPKNRSIGLCDFHTINANFYNLLQKFLNWH